MPDLPDQRVRLAAFEWLRHQIDLRGEVLAWSLLARGFDVDGQRVPLLSQQGIFKPRLIPEVPLSIRTSVSGPYDDRAISDDGLMLYRYRGTDTEHRDNRGLRMAMHRRVPIIYFYGIAKGKYLAAFPVFVVADDPGALAFTVAVDDAGSQRGDLGARIDALTVQDAEAESRRVYVTATFRRRLHQQSFRERVLRAYREQCAVCRLRHEELLDAAHIIPDSEEGPPEVRNGMALCKLHHAAFDRHFIGIRPDLIVEVRRDVMEERDGPMLLHGLQGMHLRPIERPRRRSDWPDPAFLQQRYERFCATDCRP